MLKNKYITLTCVFFVAAFVVQLLSGGVAYGQAPAEIGSDLSNANTSPNTPPASDVGTIKTNTDDWTFRLSPYAWAPALSGTIGVKGVS